MFHFVLLNNNIINFVYFNSIYLQELLLQLCVDSMVSGLYDKVWLFIQVINQC